MKTVGGRRIDKAGRVIVPADMRDILNLKDGDAIEFALEGNYVKLRKYYEHCACCGSIRREGAKTLSGVTLCEDCQKKLEETPAKHKEEVTW